MTMSLEGERPFAAVVAVGSQAETTTCDSRPPGLAKSVSFAPRDCYSWFPPGLSVDQVSVSRRIA